VRRASRLTGAEQEGTDEEATMKIMRAVRHARRRIAAVTAAAAAAGLLVTAGIAGSAPASAGTTTASGPKPSVVLVHGAWADSSSWDAVVSQLQHDGYTVYVPPNPLLGLSYDSAYIRDFLHTISGPIILVGHSYGGAVITNAATRCSQHADSAAFTRRMIIACGNRHR
jgi:pimeloyl-ACP methyl ester carboxylesterase